VKEAVAESPFCTPVTLTVYEPGLTPAPTMNADAGDRIPLDTLHAAPVMRPVEGPVAVIKHEVSGFEPVQKPDPLTATAVPVEPFGGDNEIVVDKAFVGD
jgi:hypothetical protein